MSKTPAYLIFSRHIVYDEAGRIDVSGVTSRSCFEEWLGGREKIPKNVEESYRKALTSHCTGTFGMLPFTKEVEVEMLKHLRKHEAWECFRDHAHKIGSRGTYLKGYWEQILAGNKVEDERYKHLISVGRIISVQEIVSRSTAKRRRITVQENALVTKKEIPFTSCKLFQHNEELYGRLDPNNALNVNLPLDVFKKVLSQTRSSEIFRSNPEIPLSGTDLFSVCFNEFMNDRQSAALLPLSQSDGEIQGIIHDFKTALSQNPFIRDQFMKILRFIPSGFLYLFVFTLYQHTQFTTLKPKRAVEDYEDPDVNFFLSHQFTFPTAEQKCFQPDKPIGVCMGDLATFTLIDADEICDQIYRGSIVGAHSLTLRVHKFQVFKHCIEQLTIQFLYGEVWNRTVEYRCDGTICVLLNRNVILDSNSNCVRIELQDITENYINQL